MACVTAVISQCAGNRLSVGENSDQLFRWISERKRSIDKEDV